MPRQTFWTKENIRLVFATCKANTNKMDRLRILHTYFPGRTEGSLKYQILRYQKRNDNMLRWIPEEGIFEGYAANGRLHDEVWNEQDWRQLH